MVTENVYDTAAGQHLLIPQGSWLHGQYDSEVTYGQRRVLMVWTRLTLPDNASIVLDRLKGSDVSGMQGSKTRLTGTGVASSPVPQFRLCSAQRPSSHHRNAQMPKVQS
jgi:hypothetical protein